MSATDDEKKADWLQRVRVQHLKVEAAEVVLERERVQLREDLRTATDDGVTQVDLSRVMGVSQSAVSQILKRAADATERG